MHRVVVTGLGIVSCLGNTLGDVTDALRRGRSGIELLPERKALGFRSSLGGKLKAFDLSGVPKKHLRQLGPGSQIAVHATHQALRDAAWEPHHIKDERTAVVIGSGGNFHDIYQQCHMFRDDGLKLGGTALQRVMHDTVSANLSVLLGTRGYALTVACACATGAAAIGLAYQLIRYGLQDRAICGGAHEDTWEYFCQFDALKAFSMREDEPTRASRPFDKHRDGLVPSAGGGILTLEEREQALRRGATIYGEVIGYAFTSDGNDMTIPSGEGSARCIRLALQDAGIAAGDVDYVNAHATSTPVGDASEARAIVEAFGNRPYVSSTKSMTGHEQAAAGSNEVIYTLLMMRDQFVAPNINLDELDPQCAGMNLVANDAIDARIDLAVSNAFGFGGVNTCVVMKRSST
ncbi:MAG: beta-ketoacyl-[acyl-carrier-protein] synthase family protein [Candidatus Rokubacteria bacterium]|nr:beta-ketoacyl-[acyl-carrier-protein] synthase family protein [Candidatus Rokubacteria bacterium]